MARNTSTVYVVQSGDTLSGVAEQFGLHGWQALAHSRENPQLAEASADSVIPPGTVLKVPPDARALLVERIYVMQRTRSFFQSHFEMLERLSSDNLVSADIWDGAPDEQRVRTVLGPLRMQVRKDVELAHLAASSLVDINNGLWLTCVAGGTDLDRFAGGQAEFVGLNWLLMPQLLELWYEMWSAEFWASRWQTLDKTSALEAAGIHLNLVRSKILQQADARLRETQAGIWKLDADGSCP